MEEVPRIKKASNIGARRDQTRNKISRSHPISDLSTTPSYGFKEANKKEMRSDALDRVSGKELNPKNPLQKEEEMDIRESGQFEENKEEGISGIFASILIK